MINWTSLVTQGRARDVGIPWTGEELEQLIALSRDTGLGMSESSKYFKNGVKTQEEYKKATAPKSRKDLEKEAEKEGLEFAPETPDTVLVKETERKAKEKEEEKELKKKEKEALKANKK
jgi:hypothetical protein